MTHTNTAATSLIRILIAIISLLGFAALASGLFLMISVRNSTIVETSIDPMDLTNLGVLILIGLLAQHFLSRFSDRESKEKEFLLQEVNTGRFLADSVLVAFCSYCDFPEDPSRFTALTMALKRLSAHLSHIGDIQPQGSGATQFLFSLMFDLRTACTNKTASSLTDAERLMVQNQKERLDQALARLAVEICRR